MKAFPKAKVLAFTLALITLVGCKKEAASPDLCHNLNFKPVAFQFDYNGPQAGQVVMRIDLQTEKVSMEKNDSSQNVCTYDLTRAESDDLASYFEETITVCQAYAQQGGDTQRVLALQGEQQNEAESVAQPDNNVLRITKGYDQLEGTLLSLADKIKAEGDCTSSSSAGSSPGANPGTNPGGSVDPGQGGFEIPSF